MPPTIEHVTTTDGFNIAFYAIGNGPPLVWMPMLPATHLEAEWEIVEQRRGYEAIAQISTFIRFDSRGFGLSERRCDELTPLAFSYDLEAVVDYLGVDQFRLMATSFAAPIAIAYAARHPERVSHLVLWHGFARGSEASGLAHLSPMAELDWETASETFARMITRSYDDLARQSAAMLRASTTAEMFVRFLRETAAWDVTSLLPDVRVPTLVGHRRDFPYIDRDAAAELANGIPGARLMTFDGATFLVGADVFVAMGQFIAGSEATISQAAPQPPTTTAIILFIDIVESTSLTERIGDVAFRDRSRALDARLRGIIRERGGTPIEGKLLGDGVLATFTTASAALDAALRFTLPASDEGLAVHIGLHAGDVIREATPHGGSNVFGGAVNIASRIAGVSAPGEVLVSDIVRGLARTSADVTFEDRGEHALKGVGEPVRLYSVLPTPKWDAH